MSDDVEILDAPEEGDDEPKRNKLEIYKGIAAAPFSPEAAATLMQPVADEDVEIRPDGLIYFPEIRYRRVLNKAFGPGAWSLCPLGIEVEEKNNMLYYRGALIVHGRFVSEAIGEQEYFPENPRMSYATAAESAKSNCLMRCCKDCGIASELWDPEFIRQWKAKYAQEAWCTNVGSGRDAGKKRKMWRKKSAPKIDMYPWKEEDGQSRDNHGTNQSPSTKQGQSSSGSNGSTTEPSRISQPQAKRFLAMAREKGWSDVAVKGILAEAKFVSADDITRDLYDRLCKALDDTTLRERYSGRPIEFITDGQIQKFNALVKQHTWTREEQAILLARYSVHAPTELLASVVDRVFGDLADQSVHGGIIRELEAKRQSGEAMKESLSTDPTGTADLPPASNQPSAPTNQPSTPPAPPRPWTPEQVKERLNLLATSATDVPSGESIRLTAIALTNAFGNEQRRRAVTTYLFGEQSIQGMTAGQCEAVCKWLVRRKVVENNKETWVYSDTVAAEIHSMVTAIDQSNSSRSAAA